MIIKSFVQPPNTTKAQKDIMLPDADISKRTTSDQALMLIEKIFFCMWFYIIYIIQYVFYPRKLQLLKQNWNKCLHADKKLFLK